MTAAFWLLILHSTSSRPNSLALTIFSFVNCGTSQQVDPNSEKEKVKKKKKKKKEKKKKKKKKEHLMNMWTNMMLSQSHNH